MTRLTVVGLGKMGLPAAAYYAHRGATVVGYDIDPIQVDAVNRGESRIGAEPGVDEHLAELVRDGSLRASNDPADALAEAEVVIVLVPLLTTPDGKPDFGPLDDATGALAAHLPSGVLVIYETTVPVGTTRQRFGPVLSGAGALIAFSPERVSSGRTWRDLDTYPKLVGGVDEAASERATSFYRAHLPAEVWDMGAVEAAEMTKLAETTYRDLNIAFANELARFADEWSLNVTDIIRAANSQPYSHIHAPGVGVGGHCIPHYPHLLQESTSGSDLIASGRAINDSMPGYVAEKLAEDLGGLQGRTVVLLGVAYRAGVPESASSPAFPLRDRLGQLGATVVATDPLYEDDQLAELGFAPWNGSAPDAVVLVTAHEGFLDMAWDDYPEMTVVDGRNRLDRIAVEAAGHRYLGVGR